MGDKVPIGGPVDNTKVYLLDEKQEPTIAGEIGEIYISGRNLAYGYVGENRQKFMTNHLRNTGDSKTDYDLLYKTGDFGTIKGGLVYYEGRQDSCVKV